MQQGNEIKMRCDYSYSRVVVSEAASKPYSTTEFRILKDYRPSSFGSYNIVCFAR